MSATNSQLDLLSAQLASLESLPVSGTILNSSSAVWANPTTRIIYDQFSEQAISTVSDSYNTDETTTLITDADYGYVAVNGSVFVRQTLQLQSFGGATAIELVYDGSILINGAGLNTSGGLVQFDGSGDLDLIAGIKDMTASVGTSGQVLTSDGTNATWQAAGGALTLDSSVSAVGFSYSGGILSLNDVNSELGLVQLNPSGQYPALDGSQITNLTLALALPLVSTDGTISFGSTDGTGAWVNSDGSASFGAGAVAISLIGAITLAGTPISWTSDGSSIAVGQLASVGNVASVDWTNRALVANDGSTTNLDWSNPGVILPPQSSSAPAYILGSMYFDTTLNKLRIGGAAGWETVTSV